MDKNGIDSFYLGTLNEEALAKWAGTTPRTSRFHGAILYELSSSRNALYHAANRTGEGQDSKKPKHYVGILKKDFAADSRRHKVVQQIGAMRILEVTSLMKDTIAKVSHVEQEGWFKPEFGDNRWALLDLPVYTIENPVDFPPVKKQQWNEESIFLRIHIRSDTDNNSVMLGVGFPSWDPFENRERVEGAYLNGVPLRDFKKTGYGWSALLPRPLAKHEANVLALKLRLTKTSDLDVYLW
jgi:hypothetical protein